MKSNYLGFGTAAIGRPQYINIRQEDPGNLTLDDFKKNGIEVLNTAYKEGIRYFDTAPNYGMAEQLLMDWAREKKDEHIEVATKWGYTYLANFDSNATQHEDKEHSLKRLKDQWQNSKHLLPWLSTYQIHSATLETGVLEDEGILNYLALLKAEHGIRIGITTTGSNQAEVLSQAMDVEVRGALLFDVYQVTYNVFDQSIASIANRVEAQGSRLIIKEAMANGRIFPNKNFPNYNQVYGMLQILAERYQVGVDAIALRFCMDSIPVYKVLSGAGTRKHVQDNLKAENFRLSVEDVERIKRNAASPIEYWFERKKLVWN